MVEKVGKRKAKSWIALWVLRNRREESSGFGQRSNEKNEMVEEK